MHDLSPHENVLTIKKSIFEKLILFNKFGILMV